MVENVDYTPRAALSAHLTLFRCRSSPAWVYEDPSMYWGPLTRGGVEAYEVPYDRNTLFCEPQLNQLTQMLAACLERAQAP